MRSLGAAARGGKANGDAGRPALMMVVDVDVRCRDALAMAASYRGTWGT